MKDQSKQKIMIVVGEASGDSHGAKLVQALQKKAPIAEFEFFGATGSKLREAGVETIVKSDQFAIIGLPEVVKALPMFWGAFKKLKKEALRRRPDVVILVDFPEFNLKLAKSLKRNGLKVIYYISPQLWAWRKYRARGIKRDVDLLLAILPFEKDWYLKNGVDNVKYVGNPLAGEVTSSTSKADFCEKYGLDSERPIVALLAGSRNKEVSRILPVMLESAAFMASKDPGIQFVNALAPTRSMDDVLVAIRRLDEQRVLMPKTMITVADETFDVLNAADAAAVTSGTATLEAAVMGTPLSVVYKSTAFNWYVFRPLISVEHFGLVNLIAQERLAKELIQKELTPSALAAEMLRLLDSKVNREMRASLAKVSESLGEKNASANAAEAILEFLAS